MVQEFFFWWCAQLAELLPRWLRCGTLTAADAMVGAGVDALYVHARKAWLKGLRDVEIIQKIGSSVRRPKPKNSPYPTQADDFRAYANACADTIRSSPSSRC